MFARARTIARIGGIDVRADATWLVIVGLIVLSFFQRFVNAHGGGTGFIMAMAGAVLFFGSLLAHELGHALEARQRGIEVQGITLFLMGGVTHMHDAAKRPRDEFAIAAVGPFISLVAASMFGIAATVLDVAGRFAQAQEVLGLLGWLNLGLAIFNMVPGAPLDGGRVLRAALWAITGDRQRAVRGAARAGQGFALLLGLVAARDLMDSSSAGDGLWFGFVAWFLWQAAKAELSHDTIDALLRGHRAGQLPIDPASPVPANRLVANVLEAHLRTSPAQAHPVVDGGDVVGAVVTHEIEAMHPQDRDLRLLSDVMQRRDDLVLIGREQPLHDAVAALQEHPLALLELDDGAVTTLTTRQFQEALARLGGLAEQPVPPPPAVG